MKNLTINTEQQLYIFQTPGGISCLGFDVLFDYCRELLARITHFNLLPTGAQLPTILPEEKGTLCQYDTYLSLLTILGNTQTGTWFHPDTPKPVRHLLEQYRTNGKTVRLFYGDTVTGRARLDDEWLIGRIGRSMGPMQVPLLLDDNECGGTAILDQCLVAIMDTATSKIRWQHPAFHIPELSIIKMPLPVPVWTISAARPDGSLETIDTFASMGAAAHQVAFLCGNCQTKPT